MNQTFTISAMCREEIGKGASRRLRRGDRVPGIVYGAGKKPEAICVEQRALGKMVEQEAFYTSIIKLDIAGRVERVVLRDLQRDPVKPRLLHFDLQRISEDEKILMRIPIHFRGAESAPGVRISGGLISRLMTEVEIACLPKDLPEFIEIDLTNLEINQTIHLSDLTLPRGVEIVSLAHGEDRPVVTAYIPRASSTDDSGVPNAADVPIIAKGAKDGESERSKITAGAEKKTK